VLDCLAVSGYRSLRDIVLPLGELTVVTGANGSGKSSLYRALRLLADVAQGRVIGSLASEGGLESTLWAGPEKITQAMRTGRHPVQGTVRSKNISLKLGFSSDDYGYAIDLGLPVPSTSAFSHDPEIKVEAVWLGAKLTRRNLIAERRGSLVRCRSASGGDWVEAFDRLSYFDSMMTHMADAGEGLELLMLRERMRRWRFYDNLRTDRDAPARQRHVGTYTPILSADGSDIAAAVQTILEIGDGHALQDAVGDAFGGASLAVETAAGFELTMLQHGLLRPLRCAELSDGTLRYILLAAALLSPRPPELMILNEPEVSLHPDLLPALARLLVNASRHCQIILVSHAPGLIDALERAGTCTFVELEKDLGETLVRHGDAPDWEWPAR
jgi:predicted ATPase